MLKYLVIHLDDTSVSYCHCDNPFVKRRLISLDDLKQGIVFAMKENLQIQFVWPDYELPKEYKVTILRIDHINIAPSSLTDEADVLIYDGIPDSVPEESTVVVRLTFDEFLTNIDRLSHVLRSVKRLNIVIRNLEQFGDNMITSYRKQLEQLGTVIKEEYEKGHTVQFNMLTDRIMLREMNNCNAGWETLTLAPDGKFYVCPAFYYSKDYSVGSLNDGLDIKNPQLYQLDYAPICRICDAFQCRRCVWLNRKKTLEVNTPGHAQCVLSHLERNASRNLNAVLLKLGITIPANDIPEIDYLDPFYKIAR